MNGNIQMKSKTNFYALIPHFIVFILMMYLFRNFTDVPVVFSAIGSLFAFTIFKSSVSQASKKRDEVLNNRKVYRGDSRVSVELFLFQ